MLVEQSITDNEGRPAAFLLMARLRIERNGNEVAFSWNVAPQLPCLTADGVAPGDLLSGVTLGDACNERL